MQREGSGALGIVVVGLGIAGKARIRDIRAPADNKLLQRIRLVGYVSRRQIEIKGVSPLTLSEALARSDVHAIVVSTEPSHHENLVRQSLEAGKHVLVDYPLALSSSAAKDLFTLAEKKDVVLHEEDIGQLTEELKILRSEVNQKLSPLQSGEISHKGSYNGWIEDFNASGLPFIVGVSQIKFLLKLFGELTAVGGKLQQNESSFQAMGELINRDGKKITLTIERFKENVKRERHVRFLFEDGSVIDGIPEHLSKEKPPQAGLGLFMQDLIEFVEKVHGLRNCHQSAETTIKALNLDDQISNPWSSK